MTKQYDQSVDVLARFDQGHQIVRKARGLQYRPGVGGLVEQTKMAPFVKTRISEIQDRFGALWVIGSTI